MTKRFLILLSLLSTVLNQIECMESEMWRKHFKQVSQKQREQANLRKSLRETLAEGDYDGFKKIIESNDVDINTTSDFNYPSGSTPSTIFGEVINQALKSRNSELVQYLLRRGVDLNKPSYFNLTPLDMVVEQVALEPDIEHDEKFLLKLTNLLLNAGAKINVETLEFVLRKSFRPYSGEPYFYKKILEIFKGNMSGKIAIMRLKASDKWDDIISEKIKKEKKS